MEEVKQIEEGHFSDNSKQVSVVNEAEEDREKQHTTTIDSYFTRKKILLR
jgi:hypothetical protein